MTTMKLRMKVVSKALKTTMEKRKRHELGRRRREVAVEFLKRVRRRWIHIPQDIPLEFFFKIISAYSSTAQVRVLAVGKLVRQFSTRMQMVFVLRCGVIVRFFRLSSIGDKLIAEICTWSRSWVERKMSVWLVQGVNTSSCQ